MGGGCLSQSLLSKNRKIPWCWEMRTSGENLVGRAQGRAPGCGGGGKTIGPPDSAASQRQGESENETGASLGVKKKLKKTPNIKNSDRC